MKPRTFSGRTMAETLKQIKRDFGPDAVILHTRSLKKGSVLGIGGVPHVEITAARAESGLAPPARRSRLSRPSRWTESAEGAAKPVPFQPAHRTARTADTSLHSEVGILRSLVGELLCETRRARAAELPAELYALYLKLAENAVAHDIAQQLVDRVRRELGENGLRDPKAVRLALTRAISAMVPVAGPIRLAREDAPTTIALVGPTGVGKTTTIAKLAANLHLRQHRKVGLITIDTYRIAAVEQLKVYARIIDVPLAVVTSPNRLCEAVAAMRDRDVILIDTAGRSQNDVEKIQELRRYFDVLRPDEIHLVLASTCAENVLARTVERFGELGIDRVIFTKVDEAIGFGVMMACLQKANAKLSYLTTGQDVPDDIELGHADVLARLVLGESQVHAGGHPPTQSNAGAPQGSPRCQPQFRPPGTVRPGRGSAAADAPIARPWPTTRAS